MLLWLLVSWLASALFSLAKGVLDRLLADVLPQNTAAWLQDRLEEAGMARDIQIHAAPAGFNAFAPLTGTVLLDRLTYGKNDPFFWAVGAHELGHAWLYRQAPALGWLLTTGRTLQGQARAVARAALFVGLLLAIGAPAQGLLHGALVAALGMGGLVLLDEGLASLIGLRLLVRRAQLGPLQLLGAGVGLLAAFLTYSAVVVADGAMLLLADTLWPVLAEARSGAPAVPAAAPGGWLAQGALLLASGLLALRVPMVVASVTSAEIMLLGSGVRLAQAAALVLVGLTWSVLHDPLGQLLLCVAALDAGRLLSFLAQLAAAPLLALVLRVLPDLRDHITEVTELVGLVALLSFQRSRTVRLILAASNLCAVPYLVWWWLAG